MKNVILIHGTSGSPDHFWFPYITESLPAAEYTVTAPQLPNTDNPNLEEQLPFVLDLIED